MIYNIVLCISVYYINSTFFPWSSVKKQTVITINLDTKFQYISNRQPDIMMVLNQEISISSQPYFLLTLPPVHKKYSNEYSVLLGEW